MCTAKKIEATKARELFLGFRVRGSGLDFKCGRKYMAGIR